MKLTKKNEAAYLKGLLPTIAPAERKLYDKCMYQRNRTERNKDGDKVRLSYPLPVFINHKRRIRTIIRSCSTVAQRDIEVAKYVAKYPVAA